MRIADKQLSQDSSVKYLLECDDKESTEAIYFKSFNDSDQDAANLLQLVNHEHYRIQILLFINPQQKFLDKATRHKLPFASRSW